MTIIKYAPGIVPIRNEHHGFTFQSGRAADTMMKSQANDRARYPAQHLMSNYMMTATREWRNLSSGQKASWLEFVTTYPQPTLRDAAISLTAYQNFIKRNFYKHLSEGPAFDFMGSPLIEIYAADVLTITSQVSATSIKLKCQFASADGNLIYYIYASPVQSAGKLFVNDSTRLMAIIANVNQTIDITLQYISQFAVIPAVADHIFCTSMYVGSFNGQFSFKKKTVLIGQPAAPPSANVIYGLLYNWYAFTGGIFAAGWHIPTYIELITLWTYLGGSAISGGHLKETGTTHWNSPNTGASNSSGFNSRGSGYRNSSGGGFASILNFMLLWVLDHSFPTSGYGSTLCSYNATTTGYGSAPKPFGMSIRLICDSTTDPGFVDIDGLRYNTVKIGSQVWMAENLKATHYSDGTVIPEVTSNSAWAALTSPAQSAYNNDHNLV